MFIGAGLTYFDFVFVAWGANVFQKPHTSGLFVGVHLSKAVRFFRDINRRSPQKWDDYLEREQQKKIVGESPP